MTSPSTQHETRLEVRPAVSRARTHLPWLDSHHSFNFGGHYDPANEPHGLLLVSNDDTVAPGGGFDTHRHHDMEIITWVLDGALEHRDSTGTHGVIRPGDLQRMSAGTGIEHSERNQSQTDPVHFVQMWVVPVRPGLQPEYEQFDLSVQLADGGLVLAAAGDERMAPVRLNQPAAALWIGRLSAGESVPLPDAPFVHVFVATGYVTLNSEQSLEPGDAARLTNLAGTLTATTPAEVIVWESQETLVR